jgi:NADPH:quinone reductase-like Zn-dependent oxidoreductase
VNVIASDRLPVDEDLMEETYAALRTAFRIAYQPAQRIEYTMAAGDALLFDNLRVLHARTGYNGDPDPGIIGRLDRLIESGPFEVHIARLFPLEEAADAHRALGDHYLGKLALRTR